MFDGSYQALVFRPFTTTGFNKDYDYNVLYFQVFFGRCKEASTGDSASEITKAFRERTCVSQPYNGSQRPARGGSPVFNVGEAVMAVKVMV